MTMKSTIYKNILASNVRPSVLQLKLKLGHVSFEGINKEEWDQRYSIKTVETNKVMHLNFFLIKNVDVRICCVFFLHLR